MRRSDREVKKFEDIVAIMEKCDVCRVALNNNGYPYILPLNFGMYIREDKIELYFHGAMEGTKYDLIAKDNRASFEMDCEHKLVTEMERGSCTMEYQSVIGQGYIEILSDDEKYNALCILMKHYHQADFPFNKSVMPHTKVFKLVVENVTGKVRMKKGGDAIMNISIRNEQEKDYRRVEEVTRAAFAYPERIERGGIGCPYEHWMVHELRKRDGIPELSLVAEVDNVVVGHIICSKAEVRISNGAIPVLNFGPLSVLPEYQGKGVGKALIRSMISKATDLGFGAILFFGRPEYYPQFGFKEASVWGVTDSNGYNYPAFMGMELISGYLSGAKGGKYYESDIYDDSLNHNKVKDFDNLF